MPIKNNFWKILLGQNAQVMIAGAVAYTAQATYAAFLANAAQGELGVFDAAALTLVSGAGPASTSENLFISVMRDGAPERTVSFSIGSLGSITRTVYSAPVKEISTITVNKGGFAALVVADITYTAVNQGTGGNAITVVYVVAGNNTVLSVAVAGSAITVNLATNGGGAATSTAAQVQAAVAASVAASALVTSAVTGTAATVQAAHAVANLAGAIATTYAINPNQSYDIAFLDTTPGYQPMPTYEYIYTPVVNDTIDTIITNLVNQINSTVNIANRNRDLIVTAAYNAATGVITITAINFGTSFRTLAKYDLVNTVGATIAYPQPMHLGSGFTQQVQLLQDAGDIYKGVTTNYPLQGSNPADYGKPSDMTIPGMGYNLYVFEGYAGYRTKTPGNQQDFFSRVVYLAVPSTGTTPEVQVKALFGL